MKLPTLLHLQRTFLWPLLEYKDYLAPTRQRAADIKESQRNNEAVRTTTFTTQGKWTKGGHYGGVSGGNV